MSGLGMDNGFQKGLQSNQPALRNVNFYSIHKYLISPTADYGHKKDETNSTTSNFLFFLKNFGTGLGHLFFNKLKIHSHMYAVITEYISRML